MWLVRDINAEGIQLVSTTDSADIRHVSADYAADHVHLAYASTVHGIQGETTDVSMVGPGVDAAGLYVGMTRGRLRNDAIALVRPHQTAAGVIADAMMRGLPEVTIDDSRDAARAELARAARDRQPDTTSSIDEQIAEAFSALQLLESRIQGRAAITHARGSANRERADDVDADVLTDIAAREAAEKRLEALLAAHANPSTEMRLDSDDAWVAAPVGARATTSLGR